MGPYQRTPKKVAIELLDTQVFVVSVQWVRPLEISWNDIQNLLRELIILLSCSLGLAQPAASLQACP